MLIFNLGAVVVAAMSIFVSAFLTAVLGLDSESNLSEIVLIHALFASSVLMELVGLKPRLLFAPTWIFALIGLFVLGFMHFGPLSILYNVSLTAVAYLLCIYFPANQKAKRAVFAHNKDMLESYNENRGTLHEDKEAQMLAVAYCPALLKSKERAKHNREVLNLIIKHYGNLFHRDHHSTFSENDTVLRRYVEGETDHTSAKVANQQIHKAILNVLLPEMA